jgi:hypothetical protein
VQICRHADAYMMRQLLRGVIVRSCIRIIRLSLELLRKAAGDNPDADTWERIDNLKLDIINSLFEKEISDAKIIVVSKLGRIIRELKAILLYERYGDKLSGRSTRVCNAVRRILDVVEVER